MAIVVTGEIAGGSQELDETLAREVGAADQPPAGALFRAAGPIPGGWRIVTGWESQEAFDRFRLEKLLPAFQKLGVRPSRIEMWEVQDIQTVPTGR